MFFSGNDFEEVARERIAFKTVIKPMFVLPRYLDGSSVVARAFNAIQADNVAFVRIARFSGFLEDVVWVGGVDLLY